MSEIVRCHKRLEPLTAAIEINISSPNTHSLRQFQQPEALASLIDKLNSQRRKPLFIKLPHANNDTTLILSRVCYEHGADALTIANTKSFNDNNLAVGMGGLSGKPLYNDTIKMITAIRAEVGDNIAINASGGIFTGQDALSAINAGATTIQILTALIYKGPIIARQISKDIVG